MQIQSIQSANSYNNPHFKASFIPNQALNVLWRDANKDFYSLGRYIKNFSEHYKDHKLEIVEAQETKNRTSFPGIEYTIYNYSTDKKHKYLAPYTCAISHSGRLEAMLWDLFCDSTFWGESPHLHSSLFEDANSYKKEELSPAKLYSLLTGQ
jgi:hypothetical protein